MSLFRQDNHIVLWWLVLGTLSSNSTGKCIFTILFIIVNMTKIGFAQDYCATLTYT
jgi:hypothetical protein